MDKQGTTIFTQLSQGRRLRMCQVLQALARNSTVISRSSLPFTVKNTSPVRGIHPQPILIPSIESSAFEW